MRSERGIALLEVLVALMILGTAGLSLVGVLREAGGAEAATRREERALQSADRLLIALSLLTRNELTQRIGAHPIGAYLVRIERPEAALFRIAVSGLDRPERELLVTVVYRQPELRP